MLSASSSFVKVATLDELAEGKPRAIKVEGQSIALFKHNGGIYATDNQCPHMGYPLTRGAVYEAVCSLVTGMDGVYDMRGGGCFTGGCDDWRRSRSKVRENDIYIDIAGGGNKRDDAHFPSAPRRDVIW